MSVIYTAPPTLSNFMVSTAFIRLVIGPVGSGKTTAMIMEMVRRGIEQKKGPDGYRRTRWVIVRQTLAQMKMTILLDLLSWFRPVAEYKVSESLVTLSFDDVVIEVYLIPLEEEEDQKRLLSMQVTGAVINEFAEISPDLIGAIAGRCGRYPSKADGGPTWFGIIGDSNAPTEGSDWWKALEQDRPPDWALFWQPSGLSPQAENVENLVPGYYSRLAQNPNRDWVRRFVEAEYGEDPSGTAVFRGSFKWSFHVKPGLTPLPGHVLIIGQDLARNPCSVICQPDHMGRLVVLEEIVAEDMGLELYVTRHLKPRLYTDRYMGMLFAAVGDPSGASRGNFGEEDSFDVLRRLGIPAFPASTNAIDPRIRAIETLLLQQRDGGPALLVDEHRCPMLARALNGSYRFAKTKSGQTKPLPEKSHPYSDLSDALQYACLALNSGMVHAIARRIRPRQRRERPPVSAAGWT